MKYKILLFLIAFVCSDLVSYDGDSYARVYTSSCSYQSSPFGRNSNNLHGTITVQHAQTCKNLIVLIKQLLTGVVATEVVKQTGSTSPAQRRIGIDSVFCTSELASYQDEQTNQSKQTKPPPVVLPEYQYVRNGDPPIKPPHLFPFHLRALCKHFGIRYPAYSHIEQILRRIVQQAIIDDQYLHLPTVRSIVEETLEYSTGQTRHHIINSFFKSDTGLLTPFAVSRFGQKIKVPYAIYEQHNKDLLNKLHDIAYHLEYCDGTYLVEACRAVEYLKGALLDKDPAYRRSCRILFNAYHQLILGHGCTALIELADLNEHCCRSFKKELQRQVVHTVAQFCEATSDMRSLTKDECDGVNRQASGLVNNVNNLIAELQSVDVVLTNRKKKRLEQRYQESIYGYVDRSLQQIARMQQERRAQHEQDVQKQQKQATDPPARAPPTEQLINFVNERTAEYHAARQEAIAAYTNGSAVPEQLSTAAHDLLAQQHCSTDFFTTPLETPVQQALQHEFVSIVNTTAALDTLNSDELALLLVPTVTQLAQAGAGFTVQNKLDKAITIADCCWTALDCLVAAGEGCIEGGVNTGRSLFNLVCHPVKSVTNVAQNLVHCGYQLGKVLHEVGDIAISSVVDPEQGQQKRTLFCNKLRVLHEAIKHKIQTTPPRELIKGATAIATETWLTGKCLRATAPLIGKALEKAEKAAQYIEEALEIDNNFHVGDGVVTVALTAAETVEAATAAPGTAVFSQVLERGGQLYAMGRKQNEDDDKYFGKESQRKHIFRDGPGHLSDTGFNRKLLVDLVSDKKNFLVVDQHGKAWYAKLLDDGRQLWAEVINGKIRNGGINKIPRTCNSKTGLSRLYKP